ncbi:efflux RND transporter periplasmic adaptor subunit [Pseudomonadales bacterium]|nr:efflux RND transporter periplasmic adaptor subunit [Pseudomonadales bacterium]
MNKLLSFFAVLILGAAIGYIVSEKISFDGAKGVTTSSEEPIIDYWVAPMDPNYRRDAPGKSPMGMDLVPVYKEAYGSNDNEGSEEPVIDYWVAPMDPNYRRDAPGKSPMGMDLVPVYKEKHNASDGGGNDAVRLSPAVINNLGVRTATVKAGVFQSIIETVGFIDYDESKITHVHLRAEGWIEELHVSSVGERVKKGDKLFDVYSPELVNAQGDYIAALQTGRAKIVDASRDRLAALGLPTTVIKEIERTRETKQKITYLAPQDGIVSALNIADGMHVTAKTTTVSLADLSTVWLVVDVFETQVSQIEEGLTAEVRLSYQPDQLWEGRIAYIYPQIDEKTRTLKVRLVFDNPSELLKPNMYADVRLFGNSKPDALSIPREALIQTGSSERVILALDGGRFQPVEVKSGIESGDRVEILDGLREGEKIVTSAQFLIDSEASFTGSTMRMLGDREIEAQP